jgi:ABC-type multidrug transport system fused ATPase/permease subunit
MLILMLVNVLISRKFSQFQRRIMSITDQRVEETTEVLTNIRIIKYFVWEGRFLSKVSITRQTELKALHNRLFAYSAASAL